MNSTTTAPRSGRLPSFYLLLSVILAFVFLYLRTFLLPGTPLIAYGDELHYFLHAVRMMHGQAPYRDFFTFVLPGTDVLYVAVFRIFGVHQWVAAGCVITVGLLLTAIITLISSTVLRGWKVMLPGLLFLVFDFNSFLDATHHWWSSLAILAAGALLLTRRSDRRIVAAGFLCAVAAFFTQTAGAFGLFGIALYLMLTADPSRPKAHRFRELLLLASTFVVALTGMVGYFIHQVGLRTIVQWTIYFPAVYFPTLPGHRPGAYFMAAPHLHHLADLATATPYFFIHAAVPFVYLVCVYRLIRQKRTMDPRLWQRVLLLNLIGLALFASVMSAAVPIRMNGVAPPAMILCVWLFSGTGKSDRWIRAALWTAALALLIYLPVNRQRSGGMLLDLPTGRASFGDVSQYENMKWFSQHLRPGDSVFDSTGVSFAFALDPVRPMDYVTVGEFTRPEQIDTLLESFRQLRTRFIVLYPGLYDPHRQSDNLAPLRDYIAKNYHLARVDRLGQIWERN